jgi:hypothetical protein
VLELRGIGFIFFCHAGVVIAAVLLFQLNHPVFLTAIIIFSILSIPYLVANRLINRHWVRNELIVWIPPITYMLFIFMISSVPRGGLKSGIPIQFFHTVEYFFLALLLLWSIEKSIRITYRRKLFFCGMFCLLFAFSDELHQYFVPGRHTKLMDIIFDFVGIMLGMTVFGYLIKAGLIKAGSK